MIKMVMEDGDDDDKKQAQRPNARQGARCAGTHAIANLPPTADAVVKPACSTSVVLLAPKRWPDER